MSNLLFFSCLSALLYRLGGWGHGFNTKVRDLGTPFCMIGYMILSGCWNGWLILCFLLMFGAQTTYWKKKGSDAKWFNWLFTGLAYSLAMLPYSLATGNISGFLIRGWLLLCLLSYGARLSVRLGLRSPDGEASKY